MHGYRGSKKRPSRVVVDLWITKSPEKICAHFLACMRHLSWIELGRHVRERESRRLVVDDDDEHRQEESQPKAKR